MESETVIRLVVGVVLVPANAFFVTSELPLTRVRRFSESAFEAIIGQLEDPFDRRAGEP